MSEFRRFIGALLGARCWKLEAGSWKLEVLGKHKDLRSLESTRICD
jgi:hypothetical protein